MSLTLGTTEAFLEEGTLVNTGRGSRNNKASVHGPSRAQHQDHLI